MHVIVVTKRHQKPVYLTRLKFVGPLALALMLLAAGLVYTGYQVGLYVWKGEVARQRQALAEVTQSSKQGIDALSARIGQLQSQMIRLDALGQRLTSLAKLDKGEFDFKDPPAEGGPDMPLPADSVDVKTLLHSMNALGSRIEDRAQQLTVLESLMMNHKLQQQVHPSGRPIKSGWISSYFGRRIDPFTGRPSFHPGIDFAGKMGSPVLAVASGVVVFAGRDHGYGNLVQIDHGNGYATRYGHCEKILVKVGDKVRKNQKIALMGSTGRSTGPHVHFEVLRHGKIVNPARYVGAAR